MLCNTREFEMEFQTHFCIRSLSKSLLGSALAYVAFRLRPTFYFFRPVNSIHGKFSEPILYAFHNIAIFQTLFLKNHTINWEVEASSVS